MRVRDLGVGLAALALCAMGLTTVLPAVTSAGGVGTIAYPDLISVIPTSGFGIRHPTPSTKELDYTHIVYNAGAGPLEVQPTDFDPSTDLATGVQNLYSFAANGTRTLEKTVTAKDQFFYHVAHGHYHFPLATFGLYSVSADGTLGTAVAVSPKNGFCLGDDVHLDNSLAHSPATNGYSGSTCTDPNAVRGISPGWGDRYDRADPGQAIDITGVPNGMYWFHSVVDPDHNFQESDTTNNTTNIKLRIVNDTITPVSPLLSKGSFIFDASAIVDGVGTVSTPPLTTVGPSHLLVAYVSAMGTGQTATVSGGGVVWTRARRQNAELGTAEVWSAKAPAKLTNAVIRSTPSIGGQVQTLSVFAIRGAAGIGATAGGGAATGLPTVSLKTTKQGSWVMAVGNDPDRGVPHESSSGRTMIHEDIDESGGDATFLEAPSAPTVAAGTVVAFTHKYPAHDRWDMSAVELLPLATSDKTPPIITAVAAANVAQDRATISWTTDEPATSRVDYGTTTAYGRSTASDASLVTKHVQTITGLTPSTQYFFNVVSHDSQGNASAHASSFTTTPPRTTAPQFTNIHLTDLEPDQVIVAWTTDEPTDTRVAYGVTAAYGSLSPEEPALTTSHFQLVTNLSPTTVYHFQVMGADPYGNSGVSVDGNFQAPAIPPPITVDTTVSVNATGAATTAPFDTAAAGEMLVAFVSSDGPSNVAQSVHVTGAGLTWTLDERSNGQHGTAEVWHAIASNVLTGATVTSTQTALSPPFDETMTVVAFAGAVGIGAKVAANSASGAPHATFSTVSPQSVAYAVGEDWDHSTARTLIAGQTMVHQWLDTTPDETLWTQRLTANTGAVDATVNVGDSAPTGDRWDLAAVEIIRPISVPPAAEVAPVISGAGTTVITATGATITWTTDVIATGQVSYGLSSTYDTLSALAPVGVKTHSISLAGLAASTTYHFAVVSADGVGSTTSDDVVFTTPAS